MYFHSKIMMQEREEKRIFPLKYNFFSLVAETTLPRLSYGCFKRDYFAIPVYFSSAISYIVLGLPL